MSPCTRKQGPRARVATAGEGVEARSTLGLPPRGGKWRAEEVNDQEKEMGNVDMRGAGGGEAG